MAINYSVRDTIEEYNNIFKNFKNKYSEYESIEECEKFIYFISGLGITNSVHEKFIKGILEKYEKLNPLSNTQKDRLLRAYKGIKSFNMFIKNLNLDLEEAFNLKKEKLENEITIIETFNDIISMLENQKDLRNDHLHGDFNFSDKILETIFYENIIIYQKLHSFLLEAVEETFNQNIHKLPTEIIIPEKHKKT